MSTIDLEELRSRRAWGFFGPSYNREEAQALDRDSMLARIAWLEASDRAYSGAQWARHLALPESPNIDWNRRIVFSYAEDKHSLDWGRTDVSLGAFAMLFHYRHAALRKDQWAIAGCDLKLNSFGLRGRTYDSLIGSSFIGIDDDGVFGRVVLQSGLATSGYLAWLHSTTSHGKFREQVDYAAYLRFAQKQTQPLPTTPGAADLQTYINAPYKFGLAYRGLQIERWEQNDIAITFAPQERTRVIAPYVRDLSADLCAALVESSDRVRLFGRLVELELFGRNGGDETTFRPNQPLYLPSVVERQQPPPGFEPWSDVTGHRLLDAVPLAERAISETPKRTVTPVKVLPAPGRSASPGSGAVCQGEVPARLRRSLKGVRLADLIAARHSELLRNEARDGGGTDWARDRPLILKRCPFADEHGLRKGESDGSLYIIDPDGVEYLGPTVKCRHGNTCGGRKTDEFVARLIEQHALTHAEVFDDPTYRDLYEYAYDGPTSFGGLDLMRWIVKFGSSFRIEELAAARGLVAERCSWGGVRLTTGQYAHDPQGARGFVLSPDRIETLVALLEGKHITVADLKCPLWGGGYTKAMAATAKFPPRPKINIHFS